MLDRDFFREQKKWQIALAAFLFFLILLGGGRLFFEFVAEKSDENRPIPRAEVAKEEVNFAAALADLENLRDTGIALLPPPAEVSPLTGLEITGKIEPKSVAVMIENHPGARPQLRGLDEAGIVFEVLVEGGITRFLAIFDTDENKKVGPVRSARPYFVEWAEEFGGAFVHAGGSKAGLAELAESELLDFDEDGELLFRDFQFLSPHNLFANLGEIREEILVNDLPKTRFDFSEKLPRGGAVRKFSLDFSLPNYFVEYIYDSADGNYRRMLAGAEHRAAGGAIRPVNVVIQFTEYFPIDDAGRLELRTTGEGTAWFFSGGKMWRGSWQKSGGQTRFLDSFGKSVTLLPGQTFVEVLDAVERVELLVE